jgi:hypothetical protein
LIAWLIDGFERACVCAWQTNNTVTAMNNQTKVWRKQETNGETQQFRKGTQKPAACLDQLLNELIDGLDG